MLAKVSTCLLLKFKNKKLRKVLVRIKTVILYFESQLFQAYVFPYCNDGT